MSTKFEPLLLSAAVPIAGYSITPPEHMHVEIPQAEHRLRMLNFWGIPRGSRVLEIGCGQGNCTAVLAEAVGPDGHVDAVDPGSPDYGSPWTLAQAQSHISGSAVGSRIAWHNAEPTDFLAESANKKWDYVVMAHCIWYFSSPKSLADMLSALKGRAGSFLVAEYALKASEPAAVPHVLAAITRASLEAHSKNSQANIRCLSSPNSIKEIALASGWTMQGETEIVPTAGLLDGTWETGEIKGKGFLEEIEKYVEEEKVKVMLRSSRDAVIAALGVAGVTKARTMDVWVARFT